jgi:hypothetical protein
MNPRLPLENVLVGSIIVPWRARAAFAKGLALPAAALVAFHIAWHGLRSGDVSPGTGWALCGFYWLLLTLFAVTCHRLVLLGPRLSEVPWLPPFTRREAVFAGWMLATGVGYALVQLAVLWVVAFIVGNVGLEKQLAQVEAWSAWPAALAAAYFFGRVALVFPATAIGRGLGPLDAWVRTQSNGWRMLLVVGAVPWVYDYATGWMYEAAPGIAAVAGASALIALFLVFEVCALSLSYRALAPDGEGP